MRKDAILRQHTISQQSHLLQNCILLMLSNHIVSVGTNHHKQSVLTKEYKARVWVVVAESKCNRPVIQGITIIRLAVNVG